MSKYGKRAKEYLESKEQEKIKSSLSKDNLLSRSGLAHEYMGGRQDGYTSLYKTWDNLYKRATDYYNDEAYKGFYDAYSGTRGKEGYIGKNDAGRWYNDLEKQKNTANKGVDELLRELDQYSRYYNEDAVNYVRDLITQRQKSYDDVMTDAGKFRDHWSQWATEDDYNNAVWENDFYTKLQDGNFADASAMYKDLAGSSPDNAKLSEYGEYLKAAKNNDLINKYKGMSADELLAEKERLEKSMPSNLFNANPLTNEAAKNSELMLELQFVSQLYDETALREKYASYDVDAGQADIDFLRGYAERAKEIKSQIAAIDGKINQARVDGRNVDALLAEKKRLQMSLYQLSEEYRDATTSSIDKANEKLTEKSENKTGINTSAPDYFDVVDFDALLTDKIGYYDEVTRYNKLSALENEATSMPDVKGAIEKAKAIKTPFFITNKTFANGEANRVTYGELSDNLDNIEIHGEVGGVTNYAKFMTEEEKNVYHALFGSGQYDKAEQYYSMLEDELKDRSENQDLVTLGQFADKFAGTGIPSAISVVSSLGSAAEYAADAIRYWDETRTDPYRANIDDNLFAKATNTIRGTVTDKVNWEIGNWDAFDFLYNTGMSGVDSLAASVIPGGGVVLGLSAAAQGTNDALERGLSSEQAFWNGAAQGVFEGLFESVSIGKFKSLQEAVVKGGKDIALNIVKSMLVNASEETCTEVANILYDTIVNGELANYTWEELENGAWVDALGQVGEAAASGALMGIGFGGIGSAISKKNTFKTEGAKYTSDPAVLIDEALAIDPENEYALKLKEKLESGEKISQAQLGKLSFGNMETVSKTLTESDKAAKEKATNELVTKTEKRLSGKVENVDTRRALAESLAKAIEGEHVSNAEIRKIAKNQAALNVLNDNLGTRFKTDTAKVSDIRQALSEQQSPKAKLSSENILSTYSAFYDLDEAAERSLMVNYAADVKNAENGKAINPEDYAAVYGLVYAAGKKGADISKISADAAKVLSPNAMAQAYRAGQNAAKVTSQTDLQNGADSDIINQNSKEAQDEQGVHLRDSGEWNRGKNTQGQISRVEGYAGQDQSRGESGARPRDSEAASLTYDREVSAKSLGIKNGLAAGKVRLVAEGSETASMKEAKRVAAERGLNVIFFGGGSLKIKSETGNKIINARAYIQGNNVYIRADHAKYTSDQLMRHEAGHDMIDKGEVNVADVRARIEKSFTPEEIEAISNAYALAYKDTGLTADEIWTEVICDSLGDMNYFEGISEASADMAADFLPDLKEATLESKKESRGPPKSQEGKASIQEIAGPSGTKYGIGVYLDSTLLTDLSEEERVEMVKERIKELGGKGFIAFDSNNNEVEIQIVESSQRFRNKNGRKVRVYDHMLGYLKSEIKQEAVVLADELISTSSYARSEPSLHPHDWLDDNGANDWESWTTYIQDKENTVWEATLKIANSVNGEKILYEIYPIKMVEQSGKPNTSTTNISIPQNSGLSTPNSKKVSKTYGHTSIDLESMDSDYMSAVERGDMETAQKMVDEAAKEAGYDYHLYHGTNADFTKFDLRKYGGRNGKGEGYGIYLAANREISAPYGKNVIDSFVKFNRLAEGRKKTLSYNEVKNIVKRSCELEAQRMVDDEGYDSISDALKDTWVSNTVYTYGYSNMQQVYADVANKLLKENDNDGDIINEVMALSGAHYDYNNALDFYENILTPATGIDGFHYIWGNKDGSGVQNDIYLALRSDQVKSADPVTYDDNGKVIPLSERFNSENADIRFSYDLESMDEDITASEDVTELSDRERLAAMLESNDMSPSQKGLLTKYKNKLSDIEANEAKIAEMTEELDALKEKGKGNSSRAAVLENKIRTLEKQNAVSEGIILNIEAAKPIKRLLERERRAAYQEGLLAGQMAQGKDDAPKLRKTTEKLEAQKQAAKDKLADQKQKSREKLAEQKRMDREKLAELRQKRKDDLDALAKRYQESRAKSVEGRSQTAMRHKIQGVVAELDHLLRHGNKKSNVKIGLQDAVAAALEAFDINAEKAERYVKDMARLDAKIAAATDTDEIEALIALREKKRRNSEVLADKLTAMKKAYEDIHNNADGESYPSYYRAEAKIIMDRIGDVLTKVGDTPISEMTSSQLQSVYDMYRMVLTTVRDANKAFINGKLEDLTENAAEMESDLRKIKKLPEERLRAGDDARGFGWNELTPYYAFKRIGSETLMRYYDELVRGQDVYARDLDEAKQFAEDVRKKYKANKWNRNELTTFKDKDGRTFRLNLEQMMSIYAYSKREQALDHMEKGGFFFNNKETFRTKGGVLEFIASNESGYKVNSVVLAKIAATLTPDQRAYVDEMQAYLTEMGEKGNEVSRRMWGINIFNEKVYFPLKSKDDFIYQANTPAETSSLKNDGMTKETKPHASNPIVLESFDDVWANHVEKMSKYHGFVIPIDNLNKLINYGSWIDGEAQSISTMLEARYSSAVNDYLTTFIKDLNGAKAQNGGLLGVMSNWLTKFKKTAVAASLSVVVQQPTAILRATSEIDAKYFAHLPKAETLNKKWDKIKKYAPIAIIKDIGGFDAGSGKQITEWLNADTRQGLNKAMNKVDDFTMMGAALGDRLGWGAIWAAVEREVQVRQKLKYGTEEFYKACGKRFTEVIVKTQVYDSTLSRSGFMRGKDGLLKMATAFMGEPTLSINMLADTFLQAKRGTIKKRQVIRTVAAVYSATIAASIVKSFVYALRDDDEDEAYLEKYAQALGGTILSDINPLSMLPIFRDVLSIMEGWDVERTDMAIVQDLYNAITALSSENKTTWRKIEDLTGAVGALAGIPAKNLLRTAREMYNAFNDIFDGIEGGDISGAFVEGVTGDEKSKHQTLYEALIGGEKERIAAIRKGYKTDEDYMTAIRIALRKYDPRIKKAAQALYEGDLLTRNEIMLEILKEGVFDKETVDRAIDAEAQAIKAKENESSTTEKEDDGEGSIYSSNDINVAFNYGSYDLAIEIIAELTEIKVEQKVKAEKDKAESKGKFFDEDEAREEAEYEVATSLRSVMTKYWKPKYQQAYASGNSAEMDRIEDILYTSGLYEYKSGKTIDDVLEDWTASYDEE